MDYLKLANELRIKHCLTIGDALPTLAVVIEDAMAMEREACAKICEENSARWDKIGGDGGASLECCDAIRMRSNANGTGLAPAQENDK